MKLPSQITFRDMLAVGARPIDEDIHRAVRGAIDAADRQLEDYVCRRCGQVKLHRRATDERHAGAPGGEPPPAEN